MLPTSAKITIDEEDFFADGMVGPGQVGGQGCLALLRSSAPDEDNLGGVSVERGVQSDVRPDDTETFEDVVGNCGTLRWLAVHRFEEVRIG